MGSSTSLLSTKVNLSNKQLRSMDDVKQPRLLATFTRLEEVNLSRNKLSTFPATITVDLGKNPKVVEFLSVLNLQRNKFVEVPEVVWSCVNMKQLYLDHNELTHLDERALDLYALEKLDISHNFITSLPYAMDRLQSLTSLNVSVNEISDLPPPLGLMLSLLELNCGGNRLPYLSEYYDITQLLEFIASRPVLSDYKEVAQAEKERKASVFDGMSDNEKLFVKLMKYSEGTLAIEKCFDSGLMNLTLSFWVAVDNFQRKFNSTVKITTEDAISHAKTLFETYLFSEGNDLVVPVSKPTRAPIVKSFTDPFTFPSGIDQHIFNAAQREALTSLATDQAYLSYLATDEAISLSKQVSQVDALTA
eukprot:TRINITY_DN186_c0_g2_i1.p1 TRINITY_DN186_c0_g2~~TRINITY_DN186_c0_g2_i1.p1  ORF type:complete len:362 (+),score=89.95 TRINITY_DN186_c0_g2_i1:117-1202(+)